MVFFKDSNGELKSQMDHMVENLKNPYEDMYHWCKGEMYDLQALADAIAARDNIEKNKVKLESQKRDTQTDLDNVTTGKKTIRTLLKNQSDTGGMVNKIEIVRYL